MKIALRWMLVILLFLLMPSSLVAADTTTCEQLEKIFKVDVEEEDGVCLVEIIRGDIEASHMGLKLSPETMELVFHFAFEEVDKQMVVMGEMALLEEEVNPVIDALRKANLEVSALHNHMLHEQPRILYVHVQGMGDLQALAKGLKNAIDQTKN